MTFFSFIERVIIPTLVIFLLLGGIGGALLGCALALRSAAALRFIGRMNRWVSTRRVLKPLEIPRSVEAPAGTPHKRLLGVFLVVGGALGVYFLLTRLELARSPYMPGVDLKRWFFSGLALHVMKWFFVVGSVFAFAVGALMLASPSTLAAFETRMNHWYSTRRLLPAQSENLRMPLEALVQSYPQASGWIIAAASLMVAAAMGALLLHR